MSKLKVKLKTSRSDAEGNSHAPGEEITVDADEAVRLCESDQAIPTNEESYKKALASYWERLAKDQAKGEEEERQAKARQKRQEAERLLREAAELDPVDPDPKVTPKSEDRPQTIKAAVSAMLETDPEQKDEKLWTKAKAPEVAALNERLKEAEIQVDAKERDAVWAEIREANKNPEE